MRVKAPGAPDDGPPPIPEVGEAAPTGGAAPAAPVERAAAVDASAAAEAPDPIREIARRIRAGELSAGEAVELLIDEVVERRAGAVLGDRRALAEELKELLRHQVQSDPYLASRVRRLGNRS